MDRREMLASTFLAVTSGHAALGGYPNPKPNGDALHDVAQLRQARIPCELSADDIQHIVHEVLMFGAQVDGPEKKKNAMVDGVSVPFATLPINMYVRQPTDHAKIKEPDLNKLRDCVRRHGGHAEIQAVVTELERRLSKAWGAGWDFVDEITVAAPGTEEIRRERIVTPRYVCDMDDLCNYRMGMMLLCTVRAINYELVSKTEDAVARAREEGVKGTRARKVQQRTPIEVYAVKQAYMFEMFSWITAAGYIYMGEQACQIPVGTLSCEFIV